MLHYKIVIKNCVYIYSGILALKREILMRATTGRSPEDFMLSEIRQLQRGYGMTPPAAAESTEKEGRRVVGRGWAEGGMGSYC